MTGTPEEQTADAAARKSSPDIVWVIVVWARVAMGLCLAAVSGLAFGHAWTDARGPLWWVGAMTLLTGVLMALSGFYARSRPPAAAPELVSLEESLRKQEPVVPLLGALLVYKYRYVTQHQLNEALETQRREAPKRRRLGEILMGMGALTASELDEALEHQRSIAREKEARQARQQVRS